MGLSVAGIALANLIPTVVGPRFCRRAVPGRHFVLDGRQPAFACCRRGWPARTAVAVYALPLKLNIVVAIIAAVVVCYLLEKTLAGREPPQEHRA